MNQGTICHFQHSANFTHTLLIPGAEKVGEIVVDFSYLRREGLIRPVEATVNEYGKKTKRHYKVNYTLLIKVVDRDLECMCTFLSKHIDIVRSG